MLSLSIRLNLTRRSRGSIVEIKQVSPGVAAAFCNSHFMFSKAVEKELQELLTKYPSRRSALIPALYIVQREQGYLTDEGIQHVANLIGLTPAQVVEVASFYLLLFRQPVGENVLWVCHNLSCTLRGAEEIIEHLERKLNIEVGQTTPDKKFTLFRQECLASCDTAPVMQVNEDYEENLTLNRVDQILEKLSKQEKRQ
jgi:NADH-quinone oxidoreductase subunit E